MGLFSKDSKKKEAPNAPPMPPAPSAAPAPPSAPTQAAPTPSEPQKDASPQIPTNPVATHLDDIKSQVTSQNQVPATVPQNAPPSTQAPEVPQEKENEISQEDLFDFSDLELPELEENSSSNEQSSYQHSQDESSQEEINEIEVQEKYKKKNYHKEIEHKQYFIKTSQFKALLEIVEQVKEKVKLSEETHLRLLDIKSEEDIEFENLKKDFLFIESKLYEVEQIIFEN